MKKESLLPELEQSSAHGLGRLLDVILDEEGVSLPDIPEQIFDYFIESPLSEWITDPELLRNFLEDSGSGLNDVITIRDCLSSRKPPFELIKVIRDGAKRRSDDTESDAVTDAAQALYFCTIASELNAFHSIKTRLTRNELKKGFDWTLQLPWLQQDFRGLVEHSRALLQSSFEGRFENL